MTDEEWENICTTQWRTTKSHVWKEYCWKSVSCFFITPCQSAHFSQGNAECWRNCGCQEAHHYHVFWDCLVVQKYCSEINKALQIVFDVPILLDFRTMYLGLKTPAMDTANGYLCSILLAAGKKAITKKWMTQTAPTIKDWTDIIMDIRKMEKITFGLHLQLDKFERLWNNWDTHTDLHLS